MSKFDEENNEKTNAEDLAQRIRRHKLEKEEEAEEEEEEKRRRRAQQETEEDDENLQEDDEKEDKDKKRKKEKDEKDDEEEEDKVDQDEAEDGIDKEESENELGNNSESDVSNSEDGIDSSQNLEPQTDGTAGDVETGASSSPELGPELGSETGLETEAATGAGADAGLEAETAAGTNAGAGLESEIPTVKGIDSKLGSEAAEETSTGAGLGTETATGANAGAGLGAETATGANVGAGLGAGTATGANAGAGLGAETATGVNAGAGLGAGAATGGAEAAMGTTAGAAGAGASAGASAGAAAGAGVAAAGIGVFGIVIIVILAIIIIIGIIFFFIAMPGMVVGKIADAINKFRENVEAFFDGNNAAKIFVNREQVLGAAEYLSQMGYDLQGYGFLDDNVEKKMTAELDTGTFASIKDWWSSTDESDSSGLPLKSFSDKNLDQRKSEDPQSEYQEVYLSKYKSSDSDSDIRKNILFAKKADGEITFAKSKYLATYLSADNAIYLIRNDNTDIFNRAANLIGMNDPSKGSGLVYFINAGDQDIKKYVVRGARNIKFRDADGWFNYNKVNVFRESRTMVIKNEDDGWFKSTNYTYSLDGWASKYGVPLQLSLALHLSSLAPDFALEVAERGTEDTAVEMGLVENEDITVEPALWLDLGEGKQYYKVSIFANQCSLVKENGDLVTIDESNPIGSFSIDENAEIPSVVVNAFEGKLTAEEVRTFLKEVCALDITTEDFTKLKPIILSVTDHWYQDLNFKGCYEYTGTPEIKYSKYSVDSGESEALKKGADAIYVKESDENGDIQQIAEPTLVGEPGEWIKNLIDNKEYYKYDGTRKSKEKSKIDFKDTAVDAIAMLEQINGDDAKDIIRMFKELMASYDIYFEESQGTKEKKELFSKIIRNYSGDLYSDGDDCYYKAIIPPSTKGFKEDLIVQSPIQGTVTYKTEDSVCIEITKEGNLKGYTIFISGFTVNEDIYVGKTLENETELGKTRRQDLKLVLRDENGAIVKNKYEQTLGNSENEEEEDSIGEVDEELLNKDVRVSKTNPKYTKKQLKKIFQKYGNGQAGKNLENWVDSFYKLQTDYGVNPLFAAAVTINEQSVGTADSTCSRQNNLFSVRALSGGWVSYSSPQESIDRFGNMIANGKNYFTQNKYTIKKIGKTYCSPPDNWIKKVALSTNQLESYDTESE